MAVATATAAGMRIAAAALAAISFLVWMACDSVSCATASFAPSRSSARVLLATVHPSPFVHIIFNLQSYRVSLRRLLPTQRWSRPSLNKSRAWRMSSEDVKPSS